MAELSPEEIAEEIKVMPPVMRAAVESLVKFNRQTDMGYDPSCFFEDILAAVTRAIEPWKGVFG